MTWLDRLRTVEKTSHEEKALPKLSKGASGSFGSSVVRKHQNFSPTETISPALSANEWREYLEERLAAATVGGEQPEAEARAMAHECCVVRWLDMHAAGTSPASCAHCGRPEAPGAVVVPYGTGPHTWLHPHCWRPWFTAQRAEAEAALAGMGIT